MRLTLQWIIVPVFLSLACFGNAQSVLSTPAVGAAQNIEAARSSFARRRKVYVQPKSRSILPTAKDLVSTAESGASRHVVVPAVIPTANVMGSDSIFAAMQPPKGHWILVYRIAQCVACDRLLTELSTGNGSNPITDRNFVVLVGTPRAMHEDESTTSRPSPKAVTQIGSRRKNAAEQSEELTTIRSKFSALENAAWRYDSKSELFRSLKLTGFPMMYGMEGDRIVWRSAGVSSGSGQRVSSWLSTPSTSLLVTPLAATVAPGSN